MVKRSAKNNDTDASFGFEAKPRAVADALRNNMDAAEYDFAVQESVGPSGLARASTTARKSRTLAEIRAALLPKLISGGLQVKNAERLAGSVT